MRARAFAAIVLLASAGHPGPASASAADGELCLGAAEKVDGGQTLSAEEIEEARGACGRAITATASIFQKYQFEEAYFAVTGERYKY
ncbi:hypothetical protein [Methyloceanibacter caenitepidi]|uniref:YARHG domain-containing protein n=1 Tax=Methyloceanibacter caenitepidi TaxID=1384459 RepID=A0A0A8K6M9_9HYPH|nr:hypothetical protein [Methyloceanibacter caenitepidi]BAQ18608.1 hypothetical protein GL4_3177 [Methyloceanibacter caenitepidi]